MLTKNVSEFVREVTEQTDGNTQDKTNSPLQADDGSQCKDELKLTK